MTVISIDASHFFGSQAYGTAVELSDFVVAYLLPLQSNVTSL